MLFEYEALDKESKSSKGVLEANSKNEAIAKIRALKLHPVKVETTKKDTRIGKADREQVLILTRLLGELLKAKISLLDIFVLAKEEIKDKTLSIVIDAILEGLRNGLPLSAILSRYPGIFSPVYRALVKAGEETGKLDVIFEWNTKFLERTGKTKQDIAAALLYPFIVFIAAAFLLAGVVFLLMPQFEKLYTDLGAKLPFVAGILFQIGRTVVNHPVISIIILLAFICIPIALFKYKRTAFDKFLHTLPVVREILFLSRADFFSYALGILLQYKIPANSALETIKTSFDDQSACSKIDACISTISSGGSIGKALKETGLIDASMAQLLVAGEASGRLDQILLTISSQYKQKLENKIKVVMALLQPALILALGLVIGIIVVSMFLPIFKLATFM